MDPRLFEQYIDGRPIRRFTEERLDRAINEALADIGPDTTAVSVDVDFDGEGVRGVVAFRSKSNWSVALIGEVKRGRGPVGGVQIRKEWR